MTTSDTQPKPPSRVITVLSLLLQIGALATLIALTVVLARVNSTLNDLPSRINAGLDDLSAGINAGLGDLEVAINEGLNDLDVDATIYQPNSMSFGAAGFRVEIVEEQ